MPSEKFIEVNCETCQTPFQAVLKEVKRGNGRFCSLKCSATRHRPTQEPNCSCTQCGEPFYRNPTELKKSRSGLYFCSRACKDEAQKISSGHPEIQPHHYGTARAIRESVPVESYASTGANMIEGSRDWLTVQIAKFLHHNLTDAQREEIRNSSVNSRVHYIHYVVVKLARNAVREAEAKLTDLIARPDVPGRML